MERGEEPLEHQVADPAPSPAAIAQRKELHQYLLQTLQLLREEDRTVVILRDVQGCSYEEIAQVLGCRLGTVKSRLSRARAQLRGLLDGKVL